MAGLSTTEDLNEDEKKEFFSVFWAGLLDPEKKSQVHSGFLSKFDLSFEEYSRLPSISQFWDRFRLTDPRCLELHPEVNPAIQTRNPEIKELSATEEAIYSEYKQHFLRFIETPNQKKILRIATNIPDSKITSILTNPELPNYQFLVSVWQWNIFEKYVNVLIEQAKSNPKNEESLKTIQNGTYIFAEIVAIQDPKPED